MTSRQTLSPLYLVAVVIAVVDSLLVELTYSGYSVDSLFTIEPFVAAVAGVLLIVALALELKGKRLFASPASIVVFGGAVLYLVVSVPFLALYFTNQTDLLQSFFGAAGELTLWLGRLGAFAMVMGVVMIGVRVASSRGSVSASPEASAVEGGASGHKRAGWRWLTRIGGVLSILAVVEPLVVVMLLFVAGTSGMAFDPEGGGMGTGLLTLAIANLAIGPVLAGLGVVLGLIGALVGLNGAQSGGAAPRRVVWWGIGLAASALLAYFAFFSMGGLGIDNPGGDFTYALIPYVFFAAIVGGVLVIAA